MAAIDEAIAAWVGARDAAEVDRVLNGAGLVSGPVYSIADIFADAHYRERGMLVSVDDPDFGEVVMPGVVPKLSETPGAMPSPGAWPLGADNRAVLGGLLGLDDGELAALAAEGVI